MVKCERAKLSGTTGIKVVVYAGILMGSLGCASIHNRVSGTPWSQTAWREEQQQHISDSPDEDQGFIP